MAWLVLDLTGSLSQLGGVVFVRGMPWLVCGLFGGVLADRYSRLKLLYVTQTATALNMTVLAVAVSTGIADIHYAYVSSFIMGIVSSLTQPAKPVFCAIDPSGARSNTAIELPVEFAL